MLLDEIITLLSDEGSSLNSALLKTKVLLHSLGKKELAAWVTNELKGYPDENVPEYRLLNAEVHGHVVTGAYQMQNYLLPIKHLPEEQQKNLTTAPCMMSISSVEQSVRAHRDKGNKLIRSLPPEYGPRFEKALTVGTHVYSAWCEISPIDVENILTEVRSRLLDFSLELRDVVGSDVPESELAEKAAELDTGKLFQTAIYGSGNTIIVNPTGTVQTITNQRDDLEGLIKTVGELGFAPNELEQLKHAVLEDQSEGKVPDVSEGKTGNWFSRAVKEAGKGVVKGGIDLTAKVIVEALKRYTG